MSFNLKTDLGAFLPAKYSAYGRSAVARKVEKRARVLGLDGKVWCVWGGEVRRVRSPEKGS